MVSAQKTSDSTDKPPIGLSSRQVSDDKRIRDAVYSGTAFSLSFRVSLKDFLQLLAPLVIGGMFKYS